MDNNPPLNHWNMGLGRLAIEDRCFDFLGSLSDFLSAG